MQVSIDTAVQNFEVRMWKRENLRRVGVSVEGNARDTWQQFPVRDVDDVAGAGASRYRT